MKDIILLFTVVDLLFLPYISFVVMPISLGVNILYFFLRKKYNNIDKLNKLFFITVLLTIAYTLFFKVNFIVDDLKRMVQLMTSFIFYFNFKNYILNRKIEMYMNIIYLIWCIYILFGIYIFKEDPFKFIKLVTKIYPLMNQELFKEWVLYYKRYTLFFMDPNSMGFFIVIVNTFFQKLNKKNYLLGNFISIIAIIMTQSRGVLLGYILIKLYEFYKLNKKNKIKVLLILGLMTTGLILIKENINYNLYFDRILKNGTDGGGRLKKYSILLTTFNFFIIGKGYTILKDNYLFKPHSDHIRFLISYGIISYVIFLYKYFLKNIYVEMAIIGIICFTLNTLVDEQKLLSIFLLLSVLRKREVIKNENNYSRNRVCRSIKCNITKSE